MATIINDYTFPPTGRPEKYPWNEWFDGKTRRLQRGVDFSNHPGNFRMTVYQAARRRGVVVQTSLEDNLDSGIALVIQAYEW